MATIIVFFTAVAGSIWTLAMASDPKPLDLSFLSVDINNQINRSKEVLDQAKKLQDIAAKLDQPDLRASIEKVIQEMLGTVRQMSANVSLLTANSTSSIALSTGRVVPTIKANES